MISIRTFRCAILSCGIVLVITDALYSAPPTVSTSQLTDPVLERRVDGLLRQMTLKEKIGQLVQYRPDGFHVPAAQPLTVNGAQVFFPQRPVDAMQLAEHGLLGSMLNLAGSAASNSFQRAAVERSRLHIPILFGADVIHGYRTIFPVPLGLAASFDTDLITSVASTSAQEASSAGIRWVFSPMVDISRDARWGRAVEGAGEDPWLGAAMARAYVRGYQGETLSDPGHVAACVKHFAAYGAAEAGREYNSVDMSETMLRQIYLAPYQAAVQAGAATVMSSFNALNGVPATANPFLLTKVLRDEWKFKGFVISDYNAVMELRNHGIALDAGEASRKAFLAGVDVDMMSHYYDANLPELVRSGKISIDAIDEAVRRVLRVKFALGLFEHPYIPESAEVVAAVPEHRELARRAAEESVVLLKNECSASGQTLLPLESSLRKIALIGPLADSTSDMAGPWAPDALPADVTTLKAALEKRMASLGGSLTYVRGTGIETDTDAEFAAALNAAREADVVVLALGESYNMSGEAASRAFLGLPGKQEQLLDAIAKCGKPIVLIVFSGRPLVLSWAAKHIPAILQAWFPGDEAGPALVNILFGDTAPSAKLPMSFPRTVGQEPLYYNQLPTGRPPVGIDLSVPPTAETRNFSRYIDVDNAPLFPFGYGLSYTTFRYSNVGLSRSSVPLQEAVSNRKDALVTATATLTNSGARRATEVVQLYVQIEGSSIEQPVRNLRGLKRVTLDPGESAQVIFDLGFDELSFYNVENKLVMEPVNCTVWIGGNSEATDRATFRVDP
jgi:beta-glucosidase